MSDANPATVPSRASSMTAQIDAAAPGLEDQVIAWRRDFHAHPELGNRETAPPASSPSTCRRSASTRCAPASRTPASWAC